MKDKSIKIVCTIGPASWEPAVLKQMIQNGMNCARVNGAFADPDELDKVKYLVHEISHDINLMVDVKGPEVRMNTFAEPKALKPGDTIVIGNSSESEIYPANYSDMYSHMEVGQRILIGDGDVEMVVNEIKGTDMICEVVFGTLLKPGKALNFPGADYTSEVLTEKDKTNLIHAIKTGWDSVSVSFIKDKRAADYVRSFIEENGGDLQIIAKIEDQDGVDNIDKILESVDGIMVARGGLGIELGLSEVPFAQRILIESANAVGKPVITATQMLESMIENPRPTRAEVNDVATSVMLGTDSVMLSGESSAGAYPAEAVLALREASVAATKHLYPEIRYDAPLSSLTTDAITKAVAEICITAEDEISKVIVVTRSGTTARLIARHEIKQPIYAYVSNHTAVKRLQLSKGIYRALEQEAVSLDRDDAVTHILSRSKAEGIIKPGEKILLICKTPINGNEYFPNIFEIITVD